MINQTLHPIRLYCALSALEAAGFAITLVMIPTDPGRAFLFGFTAWRSLLILVLVLACLAFLVFARQVQHFPFRVDCFIQEHIAPHRLLPTVLVIASTLLTLASLVFLAHAGTAAGGSTATLFGFDRTQLFLRLFPPTAFFGLLGIQTLFLIDRLQGHPFIDPYNRSLIILAFLAFTTLITTFIPGFLRETYNINGRLNQQVAIGGDDVEYVVAAINLLYGQGYLVDPILPPETIHVDSSSVGSIPQPGQYTISYRPPGTSLFLAGVFAVFGNKMIVARISMMVVALSTALSLLFFGAASAGWIGGIAGGLVGWYYLSYSPFVDSMLGAGTIRSEILSIFWMALFSTFLTCYLKRRRFLPLVFAAFFLSCLVLTRTNYLPAVLLFLFWLAVYLGRSSWRHFLIFALVCLLPMLAWRIYLSSFQASTGYAYHTQAELAISLTNNVDVLYGVGPDHINQGSWPPGEEVYQQFGLRKVDYMPSTGENGYLKAMRFWWEYRDDLPYLLYVKLRAGMWYGYTMNMYYFNLVNRVFLAGVGFVLMSVGFRPPRKGVRLLRKWSNRRVLFTQLLLVGLLFLISNHVAFWLVMGVWVTIALLALTRPYGDVVVLPIPTPAWFITFVAGYALATMVFVSDQGRYSAPLDTILMTFSLQGFLLLAFLLFKRLFRPQSAS